MEIKETESSAFALCLSEIAETTSTKGKYI